MKVFISWSGTLSEKLGESIRNWLPNVIQSLNPYFTPSDVDKGTRWLSEITKELNDSKIGILCVTRDNLSSDWLLFEAGVLSKQLKQTHVCPVLFDVKPTDLAGPLKQFQATSFEQEDIRKLIFVINDCLEENRLPQKTLSVIFDKWWPDLEREITEILKTGTATDEPIREDREILEELLQLTRVLSRRPQGQHISAEIIVDLLEGYIALHDQQANHAGGYQQALDFLKQIHKPLVFIIRRHAERSSEVRKLFDTFNELSYEVLPKEEESQDDDIPF